MKTALLNAIKTAIFVANVINNTGQVVPRDVIHMLYEAKDKVLESNITD